MVLDAIVDGAGSVALSKQELLTTWEPLALYVVGMAVYGIFVFELYHFISRKNIFELDLDEYAHGRERFKNFLKTALHFVKYLLIYPILPVAWFVVFTGLIAVLSSGRAISDLLLVSMAVVSAIRIGAYYDERLAEDLAKMIPLALLGIFIVDGIEALSLAGVFEVVQGVTSQWRTPDVYKHTHVTVYYADAHHLARRGGVRAVAGTQAGG